MNIKSFSCFILTLIMLSCTEVKLESGKYMSENQFFYGLAIDTEAKGIQFYMASRYSTDMSENEFKELHDWKNGIAATYTRKGNTIIVKDLYGDLLPSQREIQQLKMNLGNNSIQCNCADLRELLFANIGRDGMCESGTIEFVLQK